VTASAHVSAVDVHTEGVHAHDALPAEELQLW
jgi:hypothetical protein